MVSFVIEAFDGKDMKHDPRRIKENKAQVAEHCEIERAALHPLAADPDAGVGIVGTSAVSMFWFERRDWLHWTIDTDCVEVPIPNDKYERAIVTQAEGAAAYPRLYAGGAYYRLGIPKPDSAPVATPTEVPADDTALEAETISYVYTYVDAFGAEGPPSDPSAAVDRVIDTDVVLQMPSIPSGNYNFGSGSLKRYYRSSSGSSNAYYLFAGEVPLATTSVTDSTINADLQEALPSTTWVGPPDDDTSLYPDGPMIGVCVIANGICAGFSHKTICFSEPFLPHAWPIEYRITLDEPIVGICGIAAGLLVVTEEKPYLVSGVHPAAMALTTINESQGLVNKRGLVDMGRYAIYPSSDGLVVVEGAAARVATSNIITFEDWKVYSPETIEAYHEEGKYVAFYNGDRGFIFDARGGADTFIDHDRYYAAGYHDGPSGKLLLNDNGTIRSWGDNTNLSSSTAYTWKSKQFLTPKPTNFSVVRVETWESRQTYPVTLKVWADGVLTNTITFNEDPPMDFRRLSPGFRAKQWEFELTGKNPITYFGVYETMAEMI